MELFVGHQNQKQNPPPWVRGHPSLSLCLRWFQWWLLAFRMGRRIHELGRLFIILGFRACIRDIWIREGRCAWTCFIQCKGQTQSLQFVHCLVTAPWRIVVVLENPPLKIVNGESKATSTVLNDPPPYLEQRKWVSTVHQDTTHLP